MVFGSVNANRRHFEQAVESLRKADQGWLRKLITRTVPFDNWQEAIEKGDDDIKVVDEDGDECIIEAVDLCRDNSYWKITDKDLLECEGYD